MSNIMKFPHFWKSFSYARVTIQFRYFRALFRLRILGRLIILDIRNILGALLFLDILGRLHYILAFRPS